MQSGSAIAKERPLSAAIAGLPGDLIEVDLMDLSIQMLRMLQKCLFEEEVEMHSRTAERVSTLIGQIPHLAMLAIFGLRMQKLVAVVDGRLRGQLSW